MDPPQKRRGLFGGITSSLFGRTTTASEQNGTPKSESQAYRKPLPDGPGNTPFASHTGTNASPESPVKRASDAQLSSRKIIGRPARPSSNLSYSVNAADFPASTPRKTNFSSFSTSTSASKASTALVRMPGDNPNKFNTISGSTFSKPTTRPTTDFSGTATTPRNLFRGSTLGARPGLSTFSPRVPYNTMKESFPPSTPGRPPRGSTAEINGRTLSQTTTSNLFDMRIPSPPRDLTGERLAKEVPEDSNRVGSVYADEFLAHYCPPDFDDLQRRQFFCVLDCRRLKYAANEVFAKKDWKINILNFAKEYEKSRSLIMLRYGLYEFKTVKPSADQVKQWQKDHGVEGDDEIEVQGYKSSVGQSALRGKRKAEEDLVPKDTPLTASSSNLNKRRVVEPEPRAEAAEVATPATIKNKRKADAEPEENPPSKLQKAAPASQKASATKSIFENIANGTSNDASPSLKPKAFPSPMFGAAQSGPTNGARSVFDQLSPAPSNNIFGHLSDVSKASSADDDNDSDEEASDADGEADESEAQDASQSDEPSVVASGGVATPQFRAGGLFAQKAAAAAPSNTSSDAGDSTKGRSLFDRITYGNTGQPVRAFGEVTPQPTSPEKDKSASPPKDQSFTPSNKTWSTDSPIKFAAAPSQPSALFGSAAPKPSSSLFAPKTAASSSAPAITLEPPTPHKVAEQSKETDKQNTPSEQPKTASSPLFGAAPAAGASPFGGFGSKPSTSVFGQAKPAEEKTATTPAATPSSTLFGAKPAATESETPKPSGASFFGAKPAASEPEKATPASVLFGAQPTTSDDAPKPAASPLFGAKPATSAETARSTSALFGGMPVAAEPEAPKPASVFQSSSLFGNATKADDTKPVAASISSNLFGSLSKPAEAPATPAVGFSFGATATPSSAAPGKPLFGETPARSTTPFSGLNDAKPAESKPASGMFGSTPAASGSSTPLFGAAPRTQEEPKQQGSIFGNPFGGSTPAANESPFKFGQTQSTVAAPSFGSQQQDNTQSTAPMFGGSATSSFTFGVGGTSQSFNNPFPQTANGASSTPSSFTFGSNAPPENNASQSAATPFSFGASNAAPSNSFGGGSGASTPNTQPGNMFGAESNGGNSFGSNFAFSGSQSQPNVSNIFAPQPPAAGGNIFASGLAPVGGTSTGTSKSPFGPPMYFSSVLTMFPDSPFTFGGASSLATTPAMGTPEPGAEQEGGQETKADGDDAPQEQISLIEGGPGEEDESVVHEVRAKALKLVVGGDSDNDSPGKTDADKKNPWKTQGVGQLRMMKHKTTGAVRMLLRAEPRGHVALNKRILPDFNYKSENKYVKITTTNDTGSGLETWMIQVKTKDLATALSEALETHKVANKKK